MDNSFKRIIAYVIDIVISSLILATIMLLPIDPYKEKYNEAYKEYSNLASKTEVSNKDELIELNYEVYKYKTFSNIYGAAVILIYFGVIQYALKGQTIGKKIMKLRVVANKDKKLKIWNYLLRIIILNNVLFTLINTVAVYLTKGLTFYYITYIISTLTSLMYMLNLMMIMFRRDGRGIHDYIAGTKVINTTK